MTDDDDPLRSAPGATEQIDGWLTTPVTASSLLDTLTLLMAPEAPAVSSPGSYAVESLRGRRVLLVEDNELNRIVAGELLTTVAGMQVDLAHSDREALQMLEREPFDVVLMDVQMPDLDGYEATREIRQRLALADLPVIAMTAHATQRDRALCLAAGMNDFITKPFDPHVLFAALQRWLPEPQTSEASTAELSEPSGVSFALGLHRCLGRRDLYRRIAARFASGGPSAVQEIVSAIDSGEPLRASQLAHSLISTAGTLGASRLSEIARRLQAALESNQQADIGPLLAEARREQVEVVTALKAFLDAASPPETASGPIALA
ncbi:MULTISPECIES: response regulator [unclassified Roseateles]|uniref:response regulator n=1 Tax=unclassified Roseateles TaxID=2626991 RepID=UPI0006FC6DB9|nr:MULTISPECIES: response regulator [unclassified Roseateles]